MSDSSSSEREEKVRLVAYRLWLAEGCPEGRDKAHWKLAAEQVAMAEEDEREGAPIQGSPSPQDGSASGRTQVDHTQADLDKALADSFPASDPAMPAGSTKNSGSSKKAAANPRRRAKNEKAT